ncbi:MAG: nuclear transport factor 2 family protein [Alphaproteobacteria bacterium]|nr:nuclear transport factor 2 family protein [Alphaproteobacteria bacterium]MBL7100141.1 nuclear transport factor 2 family protein [Alphaproteobacteria bacterium]
MLKKPFLSLAALASLAASVTGSSAAELPAVDPVAVVEEFHAALSRGDQAVVVDLLDDKAMIYEEGAAELSRADYASHHLPEDIAFLAQMKERVLGRNSGFDGNIAWVATQGEMTGTVSGKPFDRFTTETVVLTRSGPSWKILHIHWSSRAARSN